MKMRAFRPWRSLGGRFLLVILLGMALPTAMLAPWLRHRAIVSGEGLLRERMDRSLADAANVVGVRWVQYRSALLSVLEDPVVLDALRTGRLIGSTPGEGLPPSILRSWEGLESVVEAVDMLDSRGVPVLSLDRTTEGPAGYSGSGTPHLVVRLPAHDPESGSTIGTLEARVSLNALLSAGLWWSGAAGSVLVVFDETGLSALTPVSMQPELFTRERFVWDGEDWLVARRGVYDPALVLALAAPLGSVTGPFEEVARDGVVALLGVLILGIAVSTLLTRRITRPLFQLAGLADEISHGALHRRVEEEGPDEIRRLARAFNAMVESLRTMLTRLAQREAVAAVGEFAASLAHEVRNPLTAVRLDLERARDRVREDPARAEELLARALEDIDRLDRTVDGSLRIARSGSLGLAEVDVRQPLDAAVRAAMPAFAARGARLESELPDATVPVRGNAGALEQLFLNLLLNAAEALPLGGSARVTLEQAPDGTRVLIRDDGPGIGPEILTRIHEPFYTTKESGTGLGLPIARRIARAHGGELHIESTPGVGTTASVTLATEATGGNGVP